MIVEKIFDALSPTFVTGSIVPAQARDELHVVPPSLDLATHALLNGPICV